MAARGMGRDGWMVLLLLLRLLVPADRASSALLSDCLAAVLLCTQM
jgi:hypothetical protein